MGSCATQASVDPEVIKGKHQTLDFGGDDVLTHLVESSTPQRR